jgi:hypothetical protein
MTNEIQYDLDKTWSIGWGRTTFDCLGKDSMDPMGLQVSYEPGDYYIRPQSPEGYGYD